MPATTTAIRDLAVPVDALFAEAGVDVPRVDDVHRVLRVRRDPPLGLPGDPHDAIVIDEPERSEPALPFTVGPSTGTGCFVTSRTTSWFACENSAIRL